MKNDNKKALHFPSTSRNQDAIVEVIKDYLPASGLVLEIGSGSGEHIIYFASLFPHLKWQPSDLDPENIESIKAWIHNEMGGKTNIYQPLRIDISSFSLSIDIVSSVICINVLHISPWAVTEGLMRNVGKILKPGGVLYLYGPYRISGKHTAPSNEKFDHFLRLQDKEWGVRNIEDVCAEAEKNDLFLSIKIAMPSNNQSLVFLKK